MRKAAKAKPSKVVRSSKTGQFIGRTKEGLLIPKPDFQPKSFTVRQLQEAIRAVREEATAKAG
jgi:hypothetical protein